MLGTSCARIKPTGSSFLFEGKAGPPNMSSVGTQCCFLKWGQAYEINLLRNSPAKRRKQKLQKKKEKEEITGISQVKKKKAGKEGKKSGKKKLIDL